MRTRIIDAAYPELYDGLGQDSDMPVDLIDRFTCVFFLEPAEVCFERHIVKWPNALNLQCGF